MMDKESLHEGMTVRSSDGEKVGKVVQRQDNVFVIESGFFFPKDYQCSYDAVDHVDSGEIFLDSSIDQIRRQENTKGNIGESTKIDDRSYGGTTRTTDTSGVRERASHPVYDTTLGTRPESLYDRPERSSESLYDSQAARTEPLPAEGHRIVDARETVTESIAVTATDIRIPLAEEEVKIEKHLHDAGSVQVRKRVITENKHFTVPVNHEEVDVETVPITEMSTAAPGHLFEEETITVQLHEEDIEIKKRPVIREEVRIHKTVLSTEQEADTTVQRETAEVSKDGRYVRTHNKEKTPPA